MTDVRYLRPGWLTANVMNLPIALANRAGLSVQGSRLLSVRGRRSGQERRTPVNLLTLDGVSYLVAPRGVTEWVRNLRAAGEGSLRLGRSVERFRAVEVPDAEKPVVLRAYLRRWKAMVGSFFPDVTPDSSDGEFLRVAGGYPVFRIEPSS